MKNAKKYLALVLSVCMVVSMLTVGTIGASAASSRLDNWQGNITTVIAADYTAESGSHLKMTESDLYVGDSIKTNDDWFNKDFTYQNAQGETVTGKIADNANWYCDGAWKFNSQLQFGKINSWNNNEAKALDQVGTWTCTVKMSDDTVLTLVSFEVKALPRVYKEADGTVVYNGTIDVKVIPVTGKGVTLSTNELYVGDKLVNGVSGYWTDYTIPFEHDGDAYTGKITWLTITDPNGKKATGYKVFNGGAIDYICQVAGEYTLSGKLERVKDASSNSHSDIEPVVLCTFTVKACPKHECEVNTVNPTCTAMGYDETVCKYCGISEKTNFKNAIGHDTYKVSDTVTIRCKNCDYEDVYTGTAVQRNLKVNDPTGKNGYTTIPASAFVGDSLKNTNGGWWTDYNFTIYDENGDAVVGKVSNAFLVKDMSNDDILNHDDNFGSEYFQVGFGGGNMTFTEPGTYRLVGALEPLGSDASWLTGVTLFDLGYITVYSTEKETEEDIMLGDIDQNNSLEANDLLMLQQYILGQIDFNDTQKKYANMDGNESIDSADLLALQQKVLGI